MKRWAYLVVLFYFLILIAFTSPLLFAAFYPDTIDSRGIYSEWIYWAGLGILVVAQGVMLLIPVDHSLGRPTARRSVLWTLLASGFLMGVLGVGAAISLDEFFRKDKAMTSEAAIPWAILVLVWAAWTVVFYRTSQGAAAMDVVTRQCQYLLKGSILELLVAVPTHIVARARDYCCAGFLTFLGIAFGISVMLLSFGPGVFFLFTARWKRLHPQTGQSSN